jgi:formylglycine-generating enzyme required for sulfatase activity
MIMRVVSYPSIVAGLLLAATFPPISPGAELRSAEMDGTQGFAKHFRDCPDCPDMVAVPAGLFTMGSDSEGNEKPTHKVTIAKPFAIGTFEVTFAEWDACVAARACTFKPGDQGWGRGKHPVTGVSWYDITEEYVPWLSRISGDTYRLPTEAEWEYASGGRKTSGNGLLAERGKPAESDSFTANSFGLYGMGESVWEWVEDCYHKSYHGVPSDGSAWTANCELASDGVNVLRSVRGGSWIITPAEARGGVVPDLRATSRNAGNPRFRDYFRGFRVAKSLKL